VDPIPQDVFNTYWNKCAVPRTGVDASGKPFPDKQGTLLDELRFLRGWIDEDYLWYREDCGMGSADQFRHRAWLRDLLVERLHQGAAHLADRGCGTWLPGSRGRAAPRRHAQEPRRRRLRQRHRRRLNRQEFQGVNHKGFGDYADGMAPTCAVADDLSHEVGDTSEGQLAAALALPRNQCLPAVGHVACTRGGDDAGAAAGGRGGDSYASALRTERAADAAIRRSREGGDRC
jgi:hypothetical protein